MTDAVLPSPPPSIIFGSRSESDDILGQNFWRIDHNIQDLMKMHLRSLPNSVQQEYLHWLDGLGQLMGDEIARNADLIDKNPPKLIKWDRRGREINFVEHSAWGIESRQRLWMEKGCFGGPLDQVPSRSVGVVRSFVRLFVCIACGFVFPLYPPADA
jgi:hypothetical protein